MPLDTLLAYVGEVLTELVNNGDVKSDDEGKPLSKLRCLAEMPEWTWAMFEVDFSAIGMTVDMPLFAHAYADADDIEWHFGPTPIASTPRTSSPKVSADILNMDVLLDGFRRFVLAESLLVRTSHSSDTGKGRGPVPIDPEDCTCSECGGSLAVFEVDAAMMSVECENGHIYELEHDAFEAGFDYVLEFLSRQGLAE